ncbi:MAG: CBS domain-containing protein [Planctomycetes bacterium]|nr:CBS domain-containing protein [Planctomycetota bacterium]
MFKAETIMKTDLITAQRQDPIYEAIRTLVDNNITGLPVVDDDMNLVGVITEKDVLSLLYDNRDESGKVEDFMTEKVISFDPGDSLIDIADSFINNHFRRVPIVTNGKLVGIISRKDIIAYILKLRHKDIAGV